MKDTTPSCDTRGTLRWPITAAILTLTATGITAWLGMYTRLSLVEAKVAAMEDITRAADQRLSERMDGIFRDMTAHHNLDAHPVAKMRQDDFERRLTGLEHLVEQLRTRDGVPMSRESR